MATAGTTTSSDANAEPIPPSPDILDEGPAKEALRAEIQALIAVLESRSKVDWKLAARGPTLAEP